MDSDQIKARVPSDPRLSAGFFPELLPLCDGEPAPSSSDEDKRRRRMATLAFAYYHVNLEFIRLKSADDSQRAKRLRLAHDAMRTRETLERQIALQGLYAEPQIEGLTVKNLRFNIEPKHRAKREVRDRFNLTIPIGDDLREFERNLRKSLGPVFGVEPNVDAK